MTTINDLRFGVELEIFMPRGMTRSQLAAAITAAGVPCAEQLYGHSVPTSWKIVTDGSLGDYARGSEIVSPPISGEAGFDQLRKVCETLVATGCTVHRSCGFHVHVDAARENVEFFKQLGRIYATYEGVIDSILSPSRRGSNNTYCKALRLNEATLREAIDLRGVARGIGIYVSAYSTDSREFDRYVKLNLAAFFRHGTVEFRHHQGTTDATKAINWVKLCLRMVLAAKQVTPATATQPVLMRRSRDRHLQTVVEMLLRPEGTTRAEVMARTGQHGARLPRRIAESGLVVVKRRRNGEVRFYGRMPVAPVGTDHPITLDGLMAKVGASVEEHTYFARRAQALAA